MVTLPAWVIYAYTKWAGFADPVTATAVSLAESGGVTDVHGPQQYFDQRKGAWVHIDPVGLWQIETVSHGVSAANASDPAWSTAYAYKLSNGGRDWSPWEAYTAGTYKAQLPAARQAEQQYNAVAGRVGQVLPGGGSNSAQQTPQPSAADVLRGIGRSVPGVDQLPDLPHLPGLPSIPNPADIAGEIASQLPGAGIVSEIWDSLRSGNLALRAGLAVLGFAGVLMGAFIVFSGSDTPDLSQLTDALKGGKGGKAGEAAGGGEAAEAAAVAV